MALPERFDCRAITRGPRPTQRTCWPRPATPHEPTRPARRSRAGTIPPGGVRGTRVRDSGSHCRGPIRGRPDTPPPPGCR
jgi:hypothetical protein